MLSKSNVLAMIYVGVGAMLVALYAYTRPDVLQTIGLRADLADVIISGLLLVLAVAATMLGANVPMVVICGTLGIFCTLTVRQEEIIRYLTLAALLFSIGMYGMVVSRNAVRVLMSIELMLNAVNINLVAFARYVDPSLIRGQIFAIFILTVAAAEAAVGLAIVLAIYRNSSTVDMERFNLLKW